MDDYAKDGGEELLRRCIVFLYQIFNDSIEIRLNNAMHLGKTLLAGIFSAIVYSPHVSWCLIGNFKPTKF